MKFDVTLTLITPCYKTPKYFLERLFVSLFPFRDQIEWILVDDTPMSVEVKQFAKRIERLMPNFKLISHDRNLGISSSYADGILAATGAYVGILDHDDEVDLRDIVRLATSGAFSGIDLIYTNEAKFNHGYFELYSKPVYDALSSFYYYYPHHLTFFKAGTARDIVRRNEILNVSETAFDIAFWYAYMISHKAKKMVTLAIPFPSYGWRVHGQSTASHIDQKPKHLSERVRISHEYAQHFEVENFEIYNRSDVPYAITGYFGSEFKNILDYIDKYYYCEEVELNQGHVIAETQLQDISPALQSRLRVLPFGYISQVSHGSTIYIDTRASDPDTKGHIPGVPFFTALHPAATGTFIRLISKNGEDRISDKVEVVLS